MHLQTLETIVVAVAVIAFITIRQSLWQPVRLAKLMRTPLIFAVIGVISLAASVKTLGPHWHPQPADALIIAAELALGLLVGWTMGRFTQIRTFGDVIKSRLSPVGLGIWLAFIAVRIGMAVLAHVVDAGLAEQTGTVLIVVAVIKAIQALMVRDRIERHRADEQRRAYAETAF